MTEGLFEARPPASLASTSPSPAKPTRGSTTTAGSPGWPVTSNRGSAR